MIQLNEQIERWENCGRVLYAMPQHERERHWDMGNWGRLTECGTIACAAGHCGLDPWFRERGFKMDFVGGSAEISSVAEFFGTEGSRLIFLDPSPRPVETVLQEVRTYTGELHRMAEYAAKHDTPKIGEVWPGQGGVFAGPMLDRSAGKDYFLIVGPDSERPLDWHEANAWPKSLTIDGHSDLILFNRREQSVSFDRVRSLFKPSWYWSSEQHASYGGDAWGQDFINGSQDYNTKGSHLRARAVRRVFA